MATVSKVLDYTGTTNAQGEIVLTNETPDSWSEYLGAVATINDGSGIGLRVQKTLGQDEIRVKFFRHVSGVVEVMPEGTSINFTIVLYGAD